MALTAVGPPLLAGAVWVGNNLSWTTRCTSVGGARVQVAMLEDAVSAYSINAGQLPPDLEALIVPPADVGNPPKWMGPYLDKSSLPLDPWDREFRYEVLDAGKSRFRIWSMGPDGVSRTRDDVVAEH